MSAATLSIAAASALEARAEQSSLFDRMQSGDPEVVERASRLARLVARERAWSLPHGERAEIVQETLLDVWRAVTSGLSHRESFDGLVRTIAQRRSIDRIRRRRDHLPLTAGTAPATPCPESRALARERFAVGRRVLEGLGPKHREIVHLRVVLGLSHREIAERLGRPEGSVRTSLHKALERARQIAVQAGYRNPRA